MQAKPYYEVFRGKGQNWRVLIASADRRYFGEDMDELHKKVRKAAHDVRTPLTTIAGFADLLANDASLSPFARDQAGTIIEETRRLSEMLDTFFDDISPKE